MSATRLQRDPTFEHEAIMHVCARLGIDAEAFAAYAAQRADFGEREYGAGFPDESRNLPREGIAEAGDGGNYTVWKMDRIHRGLDESDLWMTPHLQNALAYFALAFEELRRCGA